MMTAENTNFRSNVVIPREGPYFLTDLILETAGQSFMGPAEFFLIRDVDIAIFSKSWIVFYTLGLCDAATRGELEKGFQPWNAADPNSLWVFNPLTNPIGEFSCHEAKAEWRAFMQYWKRLTVQSSFLEIFDYRHNIGVRILQTCLPSTVLSKLDIFLQPISLDAFNALTAFNYPFINKSTDESGVVNCNLLFGAGVIPRRSHSKSAASILATAATSKSLLHFQFGCGQVYDHLLEEEVYYDGESLVILDEEYLKEDFLWSMPDEIRRTIIEVEKLSVVTKLVLDVKDWERQYSVDEEVVFMNTF